MRDITIESFYSEMKDPYEGADFEEEVNERNEDIDFCDICGKSIDDCECES